MVMITEVATEAAMVVATEAAMVVAMVVAPENSFRRSGK